MSQGRLAFVISNNHHMIPDAFFWCYNRMMKPNGSFAVRGDTSIKCGSINDGIYRALELGAEWLFLMDVDQIFPVNTIPRLLDTVAKYDAKIVSVLYNIGKAPFGPVAGWFKEEQGGVINYVNSKGLNWRLSYAPLGKGVVEVDWVGAGGLLIHKDVIKDIQWPPFIDIWEPGKGMRSSGHDVNFCARAKDKGYKIYVDTTVTSDHGKLFYPSQLFIEAFNEGGMLEKMDGILHRQTLESDYWDTLWQMEGIKGTKREAEHYPQTLKDLTELIPEGATVADMGCGLGGIMQHLRDSKKAVCKGFDFSEKAIEIVKADGFEGEVADFRNFNPNGDTGRFDVVYSAHTIEHLQEDEKYVEAMKQLCKQGGKVVIATAWREEIQGHFEHVRGYTQEGLETLLQKHFGQVTVRKNNRDFIATGVVS